MNKVGAFEAKAHLSEILKKVSKGEKFIVTKHGAEVAQILPAKELPKMGVVEAIRQIKEMRKGIKLGGVSIRELIESGR